MSRQPLPRIAYSFEEVREMTGFSESWLHAQIAKRALPSMKIAGKRMVMAADLNAFLKAHRVGADDDAPPPEAAR